MKRQASILSPLIILFSILACTSIDCPLVTTVRTYYVLQTPAQTTDTLRDTLSIRTFRANGSDTLLLNKGIGLTSLSLPVGYTTPEDTLYFIFKNGSFRAVDTVLIKKENIPHFESVDCNARFFHRITAVRSTHNAIDSININNPSVDYDTQTVHFHIYLKSHD